MTIRNEADPFRMAAQRRDVRVLLGTAICIFAGAFYYWIRHS